MNRFLLLVLFLVVSFAACSRPDPSVRTLPATDAVEVVVDEGCVLAVELDAFKAKLAPQGFTVEVSHDPRETTSDQFVATAVRVIRGIDGQKVGEESQVVKILDRYEYGACETKILEVRRQVGSEERISQLVTGVNSYLVNGKLVYTEQALRNPLWNKVYSSPNLIPERVPNPLTQSGEDLYMTWVDRGDGFVSRMPVWVKDGIWTRDGDQFTLVAGLVSFRNPRDGDLVMNELVYVMRFDQTRVVNHRGILFPVSKMTFESFLEYQRNQTEEWTRDLVGDAAAEALFYEGPMTKSRLRKIPINKVWTLRDVQPTTLPTVPHGFVPDFAELKPLF